MKRIICVTLLAAALSCAGIAGASEPIRIGAVISVTGPAAWLGQPEKDSVKMIEEQINAAGGINGRKLEVIVYDSESDETKAVNLVKKLISSDKVSVIIGPSTSGESMAALAVTQKEKIPLISAAAAVTITSPVAERQWVFKTAQSDAHCVEKLFSYMKSKGMTKVAIISVSNGFGDSGRTQLQKLAPQFGITIVADERYAPRDTDMTVQLTKIKVSGAQAVVNWSIGPPQVIIMKNAKQVGLGMPLFQSHGFGSLKNIEQAEGAAEGVMAAMGRLMAVDSLPDSDPQKAVLAKYKKDYETKYKTEVSTFGGHMWDACMLAVEALREVGEDPAKIREYIEKKKGFVGISGVYNFSPEDHNGLTADSFAIMTVKGGKFVLVP
jgi:branched-chain amino acid transport system substrate-binding protein